MLPDPDKPHDMTPEEAEALAAVNAEWRKWGKHDPARFKQMDRLYRIVAEIGVDPVACGLVPTPGQQGIRELDSLLFDMLPRDRQQQIARGEIDWTEREGAIKRLAIKIKFQGKTATPQPAPRLTVNAAGDIATLDGEPFKITPSAGRCLVLLLEARGRWVAGKKMKSNRKSGERPDKIINALPAPIRAVIVGVAGSGYRLTIFDLPGVQE